MKKGLEARLVSGDNKLFLALERENKGIPAAYRDYYKLDGEATVCRILQDKQAIACAAFRVMDEERAELLRLYVKPEHRKKGLARQLLDTLELQAMFQGCTHLVLAVEKSAKQVLNLYKSLEYRESKAWPPFVGDGKMLCLSKELV